MKHSRVKLSTNGVRPMRQLTKMSNTSTSSTYILLCLFLSLLLTKSLNRSPQFIQISARHAPINPKIPPLAPTDIKFGKKMALSIVPPIPGATNKSILAKKPWHCSMAFPINHSASIFRVKWMSPAWRNIADSTRHACPSCTIKRLSFAPISTNVAELGPSIGFTDMGSSVQLSFLAMDVIMHAVQIVRMIYVKNGLFFPVVFSSTHSNHALYL